MVSWKQLNILLKLPEMRLFWYFLPLFILISAINFFFMPVIWFWIDFGIFLLALIIVFANNLRSAKLNLEIKVERNELGSIISNFSDGLIAYDENFRILLFNKSAERIFGINPEIIIGRLILPENAKEPGFSFLGQVLFPSLAPMVVKRSESGVYPQIADFSFNHPKAELRITTDKITDPNGKLLGFFKIVHDRTRELEIIRSKSEFIEVAAHQLRTPLTSINWIFESLLKEGLDDNQKKMVNMGYSATSGLLKTVNDLLDVSQMEEGQYGYKFGSVELVSFTEEAISGLMEIARQANVKIYLKKPEHEVTIMADAQKLAIALSNLVANAIKYNVDNGEVVVEIKPLDNKPYIQISVKDSGIGVPPEDINKLFTKFFRAENVQKAAADGSGLGLYITKNIIKRHGGEIWAESQLNRGSTFYFTLPTDSSIIPAADFAVSEEDGV